MTIYGLYRALIDWAVEPVSVAHNENELWQLTVRELADLPIGPEAVDALPAFDPEPNSRRVRTQRLREEPDMPWQQEAFRASEPRIREENLQRHYKALNPHLAAAVIHARPSAPQMAMSQPKMVRDEEME